MNREREKFKEEKGISVYGISPPCGVWPVRQQRGCIFILMKAAQIRVCLRICAYTIHVYFFVRVLNRHLGILDRLVELVLELHLVNRAHLVGDPVYLTRLASPLPPGQKMVSERFEDSCFCCGVASALAQEV